MFVSHDVGGCLKNPKIGIAGYCLLRTAYYKKLSVPPPVKATLRFLKLLAAEYSLAAIQVKEKSEEMRGIIFFLEQDPKSIFAFPTPQFSFPVDRFEPSGSLLSRAAVSSLSTETDSKAGKGCIGQAG